MPFLQVNGCKLFYNTFGNGSSRVILIMGLSRPHEFWEIVYSQLIENDCTVLAIDNRGCGASESPSGRYTTSMMALDCLGVMDEIGWRRDVHVVGISMGGMIALELVLADIHRFSSLVLTSTHAGRSLPSVCALALPVLTKVARAVDYSIHHTQLDYFNHQDQQTYLPKGPVEANDKGHQTRADSMHCEVARKLAKHTAPELNTTGRRGQILSTITHHVSRDRLLLIRASGIRVLVVTGTWDKLVRVSNSRYLSEVLGCHVEVFEGAGHCVFVEQPERYNRLVLEHIKA